jgi:hypothetical protein
MFPFLAITAYFLAPERLDEILQIILKEKKLTDRLGAMPIGIPSPTAHLFTRTPTFRVSSSTPPSIARTG